MPDGEPAGHYKTAIFPWIDAYSPRFWSGLVQSNEGVSTLYQLRHEGQILNNFKKCFSIKVIKILLDSMIYETLKWPQIVPFCISLEKKIQVGADPDPLPFKNDGVHTIKPQLRPWWQTIYQMTFWVRWAKNNGIVSIHTIT